RRINKTTEHYDKYSQRFTTTGTDFSWQGMRLSDEANAQQHILVLLMTYKEESMNIEKLED
ncbi:hypothetical protein GASC598B02_008220, partial [Gilliamella apicola SCGC AB-598-B02]